MIRIAPAPTFTAPVTFTIAGQEPQTAQITFRVLDRDSLRSLLIVSGVLNGHIGWLRRAWEYIKWCLRLMKLPSAIDVLHTIIESWELFDAPYSKQALRTLSVEIEDALTQILRTYLQEQEAGRRKN